MLILQAQLLSLLSKMWETRIARDPQTHFQTSFLQMAMVVTWQSLIKILFLQQRKLVT